MRSSTPTTAEGILALNGDGIHRELFRGELRERPDAPYTWKHGAAAARLALLLGNWLDSQPQPRGDVVCGDAGFILGREPDSVVAIDVAYVSAEQVARTGAQDFCFEGPPVLAVEILSPSDRHDEVVARVGLYLEFGSVVWVVDTDFQTITVHRPGQLPETLNTQRELSGDPYLPGFRISVAEVFEE